MVFWEIARVPIVNSNAYADELGLTSNLSFSLSSPQDRKRVIGSGSGSPSELSSKTGRRLRRWGLTISSFPSESVGGGGKSNDDTPVLTPRVSKEEKSLEISSVTSRVTSPLAMMSR